MSVKTIFKCLIFTVLVSVVGLMLIEMYNIAMISPMVRVLMNRNLSQACQLYAQETYKKSSDGNLRGVAKPLISVEGAEFAKRDLLMAGNIYMRKTNDVASNSDILKTTKDVYEFIYGDGTNNEHEFIKWYKNTTGIAGKWRDLDKLAYALGVGNITGINLTEEEIEDGKRQKESKMTALNIGATYLDKTTVTNICRYQLASTLMNNIPSNLVLNTNTENDGISGPAYSKVNTSVKGADKPYVKFNGFWIYWDTFDITDIKYKVYDLGYIENNGNYTETDKTNILEFQELTGIDVPTYIKNSKITEDDERRYVVVAELSYSCKVRYEGTTALSKIFKYAFARDSKVAGWGDENTGTDQEADLDNTANIGRDKNKGVNDGNQVVTDKIIYYNIR